MAKVNDTNRWAKNQLFYTFTAKRDFGRASGLDQAGIESKFQKACDEWAAHSGLTFTKSEGNADIIVSWGKIARKNGILPGGKTETVLQPNHMARMQFNDDISWTASIFDNNYADFF